MVDKLLVLDKNQVDLFFNFTARHKRFLKLRETSFTAKQIEYGTDVAEKAVKAAQGICKATGLVALECFDKPAKKTSAVKEMRKKSPKLTPKQAMFILDNFEAFQFAVAQSQSPVALKIAKKAAEFGDKYYQPTEHKYR